MQRNIKAGHAADAGLIFHIFAMDSASTTGAGKASVAFGSWACRYIRAGGAISGAITPEDITTIGTYAAPTANTNIRIKAVDNTNMIGVYELQLHLDWLATGSEALTIFLTATGVAPVTLTIPLVLVNPQVSVTDSNVLQINSSATAAARLERSARTITLGTVGAASTTTAVIASSLDPASSVVEQWTDKIMSFDENTTTAALRGQSTLITAYAHGSLTFTVEALTTAPVSGDTFTIT